ncbi:MAG: response regulator transcription factor [Candidatus Dojkabacteria bacterium]
MNSAKHKSNGYLVLLEDNVDMALAVVKYFIKQGFFIEHFATLEQASIIFTNPEVDCFLIDINLPDGSGFEAARKIKSVDSKAAVIAVSARYSVEDKLKAFKQGFDDYIVKPFDLREVQARAELQIRDKASNSSTVITAGEFSLDIGRHVIRYKSKSLNLTKIEFKLLAHLINNANILVKSDNLIEAAWGLDSETLFPPIRMHISNLRKKVCDDDYRIIETISGLGYKLNTTNG